VNGSAKIFGEYSSAMPATDHQSHALPENPELAQAAVAMRDAGHWGLLFDDKWRFVYVTDDMRRATGGGNELARWRAGHEVGAPAYVSDTRTWLFGAVTIEHVREQVAMVGPLMLADHVYTPLADLPTATDKARRDAPAIAVCEI
jgi:hypothetical protein